MHSVCWDAGWLVRGSKRDTREDSVVPPTQVRTCSDGSKTSGHTHSLVKTYPSMEKRGGKKGEGAHEREAVQPRRFVGEERHYQLPT